MLRRSSLAVLMVFALVAAFGLASYAAAGGVPCGMSAMDENSPGDCPDRGMLGALCALSCASAPCAVAPHIGMTVRAQRGRPSSPNATFLSCDAPAPDTAPPKSAS